MLIKALCDYYDILAAAGDVLPEGYSNVKINYVIALKKDGSIDEIIDRQVEKEETLKNGKTKKKIIPRIEEMPKRTEKSGIDANVIEHRPVYIFGLNYDGERFTPEDATGKAGKSHDAFVKKNLEFFKELDSPIAEAYRNFILNWNPDAERENRELMKLGKKYGAAGYAFCLSGEPDRLLHNEPEVKKKWEEFYKSEMNDPEDSVIAQCAVSGEFEPIARVHDKIKGVYGGLSTGSVLVGFNNPSEESYGNEQSYNSNISEKVMRKYTEALNYLLANDKHKIILDDMTIIFWAMDSTGKCEDAFMAALGLSDNMAAADTEKLLHDVWSNAKDGKAYLEQLEKLDGIDENVDFYMVGFKPNVSRLAIKFIDRKKYSDVLWNIAKFQQDVKIKGSMPVVPIYAVKKELKSPKSSNEKIDPTLMTEIWKSVINNNRHPMQLLSTLVKRVKTDVDLDMNSVRAGFLKSCINRIEGREEITMGLNTDNNNQAYVCGRLFAVLEKLQQDASNNSLNATIKNKYFSSASSKPALVFPKLIKLAQTHLNKLKGKKRWVYYDKTITEIMCNLDGRFPETLLLQEQGEFEIGYYQQKQVLYTKQDSSGENAEVEKDVVEQ